MQWPYTKHATCTMSGHTAIYNLTMRNIFINNPDHSPGVLLGNDTNPIELYMENVIIKNDYTSDTKPFGNKWYCENVVGTHKNVYDVGLCY